MLLQNRVLLSAYVFPSDPDQPAHQRIPSRHYKHQIAGACVTLGTLLHSDILHFQFQLLCGVGVLGRHSKIALRVHS